jgi:hypothetical protein
VKERSISPESPKPLSTPGIRIRRAYLAYGFGSGSEPLPAVLGVVFDVDDDARQLIVFVDAAGSMRRKALDRERTGYSCFRFVFVGLVEEVFMALDAVQRAGGPGGEYL